MKSKLFNRIKKSSFVTAVFKVGIGQLIGQLLSLVSVPILSRIYPDSAYGEHALIISTATLMISITTFGLNSAIMKPQEDAQAKRILTTALIANVSLTSVFILFCAVLSDVFVLFTVQGSYAIALLLIWLYVILTNLSGLLYTYVNRKGQYNRLLFCPIIGSVANFAIAIPLGLLHFGYGGFLLTGILSNLVICIVLARNDVPIYSHYRARDFIAVFKAYRDYVLFQYPANFISNSGFEYPMQYLGRAFSAQALGGYAMCVRVLKYPLRLIATPISTVYFRTASVYHSEGKNLADFTYKMISRILMISFVPVAAFCLFSENIFAFVLGEAWKEAGMIAAILSVQYVMMFCSQCTSYCRVAIGQQKVNLAFACVRLVIIIASASIGYAVMQTLTGTIIFMTVAQSICWIMDMGLNFICMDRKYTLKYLPLTVAYAVAIYAIVLFKRM